MLPPIEPRSVPIPAEADEGTSRLLDASYIATLPTYADLFDALGDREAVFAIAGSEARAERLLDRLARFACVLPETVARIWRDGVRPDLNPSWITLDMAREAVARGIVSYGRADADTGDVTFHLAGYEVLGRFGDASEAWQEPDERAAREFCHVLACFAEDGPEFADELSFYSSWLREQLGMCQKGAVTDGLHRRPRHS